MLERVDAVQRRRPWLAFPVAVLKKFGDDRASRPPPSSPTTASSRSSRSCTGLGFVLSGNEDLRREIVGTILRQFPEMGERIGTSIGSPRGSGFGLIVGVAGLLWTGQ